MKKAVVMYYNGKGTTSAPRQGEARTGRRRDGARDPGGQRPKGGASRGSCAAREAAELDAVDYVHLCRLARGSGEQRNGESRCKGRRDGGGGGAGTRSGERARGSLVSALVLALTARLGHEDEVDAHARRHRSATHKPHVRSSGGCVGHDGQQGGLRNAVRGRGRG